MVVAGFVLAVEKPALRSRRNASAMGSARDNPRRSSPPLATTIRHFQARPSGPNRGWLSQEEMVNAFRNYRCYNGQMWAASISRPEEMTWDDRRALMEMVFNDRPSGDKRMGVYVSGSDQRSGGQRVWSYHIHGRLADLRGTTSDDYDTDSGNAHLQRDVLKEVANKNASSPDELNHGPF